MAVPVGTAVSVIVNVAGTVEAGKVGVEVVVAVAVAGRVGRLVTALVGVRNES